ncbi:hypothetical protein GPECTOR_21g723 [Gonium pectorale]|uniref:Peptidase M11 gametolysin domain-containing protein n=1 Tax=Gonium pectorale TaxID=33097 RepID=A0A150GI46_GONPE|nr:hypothetical protein GPECTOR_21g723 [Gonium pectorale]|eukprot:KXZ49497.1 hypothetical protein GPECTOR_21g723 [Gonium pectorale]
MASGVSGRAEPAMSAPGYVKKLQGQLALVDMHEQGAEYVIVGDDGAITPFASRGVKPPKKDKDGNDIELGAIVGLNCPTDPVTGQCSYISSNDTILISGAATPTAVGKPISQRLLVMIIDYSTTCGQAANLTEADVRTLYLGAAGDGSAGHALKFEQCSYGSFIINATAFTVITVQPWCNATISTSCSYSAISGGADAAAKALIGTAAFATYTHYTYILPTGYESICRWSGLALLPGKQTWLQTSNYGVRRWATVMQETIHNYGLWHSWQNGVEYDDYSTSMGRGNACPNAAEISRMGWASPASNGGAINATTMPAGSAVTFSLPATSLTGSGNYLRIRPNWLASYGGVLTAKNLYIAVRVSRIGDAALSASYAPRINVHEVNATMDNAYPTSYVNGDRQIAFIGSVVNLTSVTFPAYNLVVYSGAWPLATAAAAVAAIAPAFAAATIAAKPKAAIAATTAATKPKATFALAPAQGQRR